MENQSEYGYCVFPPLAFNHYPRAAGQKAHETADSRRRGLYVGVRVR